MAEQQTGPQPDSETTAEHKVIDVGDIPASDPNAEPAPRPEFEDPEVYAARVQADREQRDAAAEARRAVIDAKPVTVIDPENRTQSTTTVGELDPAAREAVHRRDQEEQLKQTYAPDGTRREAAPGTPVEQSHRGIVGRFIDRLRGGR